MTKTTGKMPAPGASAASEAPEISGAADPEATGKIVEEFVERLGLVVQAEGLPRIAGRLMGLLVIHGGPFSFTDLAQRLQVSRGSISTNTRLLEHLGLIERMTRPGERQDYFRMRHNPYAELLKGSLERLYKARELIDQTRGKLPEDWAEAQGRLAELEAFYRHFIELTETMIGSGKNAGRDK